MELMRPSVVTLRIRLSPVSAMYTLPLVSAATPPGRRSSALVARPPSLNVLAPPGLVCPVPAKVLMMPAALTMRTRLFFESAMYRLPVLSSARPCGAFNCARVAGPPSPEKPGRELPAISVRFPPPSILNPQFKLLKWTFPDASTITRSGCPIEVLAAAAGVGGGAPPATVATEYCCPSATWLAAISEIQHSFPNGFDITRPVLTGDRKSTRLNSSHLGI